MLRVIGHIEQDKFYGHKNWDIETLLGLGFLGLGCLSAL